MNNIQTNLLPARIGFWSAFLSATALIIYTLCFIAILIVNPLFVWTNFSDYVASIPERNQFFIHLAQLMSLLFGPLWVLMLQSVHEYVPTDKKILTRISIGFGLVFATLTGLHYFVQLSAVRLNLIYGRPDGLEQFIQANPLSALAAVNMLGWTLFLGLSSFFVAPVFSGGKIEKAIKMAFLLNLDFIHFKWHSRWFPPDQAKLNQELDEICFQ